MAAEFKIQDMEQLALKNISKGYSGNAILEDISDIVLKVGLLYI